jgi:hypothetical protein
MVASLSISAFLKPPFEIIDRCFMATLRRATLGAAPARSNKRAPNRRYARCPQEFEKCFGLRTNEKRSSAEGRDVDLNETLRTVTEKSRAEEIVSAFLI